MISYVVNPTIETRELRYSGGRNQAVWHHAILALVRRMKPARRRRSNPRVIKRKVSKWPAKRFHHTHWPQPLHEPEITTQTLN
ncbi:hypothetical protein E3T26_03725 [Cryobacterium sp. TMT1-21]|uniref:Uncharacterized protein n=1 Tax=Cryobacterium shii TaxID=1259235 RepID=A0AAQ2C5L2_9MICO|nr:hypothetical protein E3O49_11660 [Cryobacterium shii]TFC85104.1 hypothetical protein E3T24_09055 [Cryobacterium sp. TmT2-59]TFD11747.1 hypothetical protein E3T42_15930 [Cryobacterium sp. TMT4-10]TFD16669.1 hypothetical protein E3T26_03725 [Cryobacterium sp. TMT1-21]TFD26132.1 hypothetical protein E3T32_03560 [Cryobacterium sp. TMT2-23]